MSIRSEICYQIGFDKGCISGEEGLRRIREKIDFHKVAVIVHDLSNYRAACGEKTPFTAELFEITDYPCYMVKSLATGKEYELYEAQIQFPDEENYEK
jgi:hypothetical protein